MATDGICEGLQQSGGLADPIGQGGAIQIEPLAFEDLALTIQRKMVGLFADQNMGQQARTGAATFDGP